MVDGEQEILLEDVVGVVPEEWGECDVLRVSVGVGV
jgi:hypothetical protein